MKTLILCVDRDDDLGRKAGIRGPVVGRESNLNAAISLALADPEDSDANAIFAAISTYDNLKKDGKDVEIATLTGDENVGIKSDENISKQLDTVLSNIDVGDIILVSDGSEDEFIIPIITSRRPVKHLRRVIVRQSKNIESTYYIIMKALKDKKIARKILMPIALIFLAYAFSVLLIIIIRVFSPGWNIVDPGSFALMIITLTLGLYFLERSYGLSDRMRNFIKYLKTSMLEAKVTIGGDIIAFFLIIAGLDFAYIDALTSTNVLTQILLFFHTFILWFVFAVIVREGAKTFDIWIHQGSYNRRFWVGFLSTLSIGVISYATLDYLLFVMGKTGGASIVPITVMIGSGISVGIIAAVLHRSIGGVKHARNRMDENIQ